MVVSYEIEKVLGRWSVTRYVQDDFSFHKEVVIMDAECQDELTAFKCAMDCFRLRPIVGDE